MSLDNQDITDMCTWSINDKFTVLNIALSDSDCQLAPTLYAQASLSFDAYAIDAMGIGYVSRSCSDQANTNGSVKLWKAIVQTPTNKLIDIGSFSSPSPKRIAIRKENLLSTTDDSLAVSELMTLLPDDKVNENANLKLVQNLKWAMGQNDTEKEWLSKFFSETPPDISINQQQLVKQSLSWYQNQFAKAYLVKSFNSYSGPNEPKHRLSTDQNTKLEDYLKTGIAKEKDFTIQQQGFFIESYIEAKSRLASYISDNTPEVVGWAQGTVIFTRDDDSKDLKVPAGVNVKTADGILFMTQVSTTLKAGQKKSDPVPVAANDHGSSSVVAANTITQFDGKDNIGINGVCNPEATILNADSGGLKWAKKLFNVLTSGSQFVLMVNRVAGAAGDPKALGPVNNIACLLTALDNSGKIAGNYFQSILSGLIVKLVPQVVHRDKDTIMQWLPTALQELFRKLANGELPQETEISATEAKEMYQEFLAHQAEISSATADLLQSIAASGLFKQAQEAEEKFADTIASRWPKLAKASRFMLALGWVGGVSSVIMALVKGDWKKMTEVERAEFVTNCVQLTVTGFDAVPLIYQGAKFVTLKIWNKIKVTWNGRPLQQEITAQQSNLAGEDIWFEVPLEAENINEIITVSSAAGTLGKGTIFERIFAEGVFSGVLKVIGAATAAAMAGFSLWQLINDIKDKGSVSTLVFDSLTFAANFLAAVCLVADLFVATSWLPIVGAVLAIAGIIVAILASTLDKPKNPVDDWMVDVGIPFIDGLPAQTPSGTNSLHLQIALA